jgi:hypothetical protein
MLTGKTPFRGTPAEVMYQHQHAPLPLEQLRDLPQPVAVLLELFLEKDPGRRFQNPGELLKAISTITGAIDARLESLVNAYRRHPQPFRVSDLASRQQVWHLTRFR